jgi:hypothetical protein
LVANWQGTRSRIDSAEGTSIRGVSLTTAVQQGESTGTGGRSAARPGLRLRDCVVSEKSPFVAMTAETARRKRVDPLELRIRTLLHLPRIAGYSGWMARRLVWAELSRVADHLADDVRRSSGTAVEGDYALSRLRFAEIPEAFAAPIIAARHYLRSARPDSRYYALLDPVRQLPVSMCSVSPLRWRRVATQIKTQFGIEPERVWDVSRVHSCDSAPPNAISYLLARVRTALRQSHSEVDLLATAVDRNLGFSGVSYRAANWQHWITVQPRPYLYHNRSYTSPRQLRERFGTSAMAELQKLHPDQTFEQSRVKLRESLIFCWRIKGGTEVIPAAARLPIHR